MHNPFTQAEEYEYREAMRERKAEEERRLREDAMDGLDSGENDEE